MLIHVTHHTSLTISDKQSSMKQNSYMADENRISIV